MWKRDLLRYDDSSMMSDMVSKLKKHRSNETNNANNQNGLGTGQSTKSKAPVTRTSLTQTQASNNLIKKENQPRKSYLGK